MVIDKTQHKLRESGGNSLFLLAAQPIYRKDSTRHVDESPDFWHSIGGSCAGCAGLQINQCRQQITRRQPRRDRGI